MKPIISVIVPVYNVEKYIERAIHSLQKQSFYSFEVLVIDDGSQDRSINIAKELVKDDERFLFFQKSNGGLSDARNYGISKSQGDYLSFLDSDDYIEYDFLEKMYKKIVLDKADICICDFCLVTEDRDILSTHKINIQDVISSEEAVKNNLKAQGINAGAWNKMYNKVLFKDIRFPIDLYYEDYPTIVKLLLSADKITFVNEVLFNYVQRTGSITNSLKKKNIDDRFLVFQEMQDYLSKTNNLEKFKTEVIISYLQYVILSGGIQIVKNSTQYYNDISYLLDKADRSLFTIKNIFLFYKGHKKQMIALLALKMNKYIFKWLTWISIKK